MSSWCVWLWENKKLINLFIRNMSKYTYENICSIYNFFLLQLLWLHLFCDSGNLSSIALLKKKKIRACIELLFSCLWNKIKGQVLRNKVTAGLLIFGELTGVFASWEPTAQYNLSGKQVRASAAASPMSESGLTKAALFFSPMIVCLTERKATKISKCLLLRWNELAFKLLRILVEYIR